LLLYFKVFIDFVKYLWWYRIKISKIKEVLLSNIWNIFISLLSYKLINTHLIFNDLPKSTILFWTNLVNQSNNVLSRPFRMNEFNICKTRINHLYYSFDHEFYLTHMEYSIINACKNILWRIQILFIFLIIKLNEKLKVETLSSQSSYCIIFQIK
jgi:hypothetical protein